MLKNTFDRAERFFGYHVFALSVLIELFSPKKLRRLTYDILVKQILFTGYEALGIISLFSFSIGAIIIIQGNSILSNFGQSTFFYTTLVSVVLREMGGIITALIVIARSGTAISTELGNMVLNNEIDALVSFGISPTAYLIIPRLLGVVFATVTLSVYFNVMAMFGSWFLSSIYIPIDLPQFLADLFAILKLGDILIGLFKSLVFGFLIATISSYQGLQVASASTEVPQRTIKAVVYSIGTVIIVDIVLSVFFYALLDV